MTADAETCFQRNTDMVWADMDGETVMLSIDRGEYSGLGGIGPRIWELLAEPTTISDLVHQLVSEYDVSDDTCRRDTAEFVTELVKAGLADEVRSR